MAADGRAADSVAAASSRLAAITGLALLDALDPATIGGVALVLPAWFGPWTAAPLGVLVTGADLPNAFPHVIAIERLVTAGVADGQAVAVLAGYALVYCAPCLVLLALGAAHGAAVRRRLGGVYERLGAARPPQRPGRRRSPADARRRARLLRADRHAGSGPARRRQSLTSGA